MKILEAGHRFELRNLRSESKTILQFMKDADIHGVGFDGPSCQEVIRALISRVESLNSEQPWPGNADIIHHARMMLAGFEARALLRKTERGYPIEKAAVSEDGHLDLRLLVD